MSFLERARALKTDGHPGPLTRYRRKCWPEILAVVEAAVSLKNADDDVVGVQHEDCSKPPCSGCRYDHAVDTVEESIRALDKKAGS